MDNRIPLGSVVCLKQKPSVKIAVIGYYPKQEEEYYDYCGVVIPFGFSGDTFLPFFNNDDIKEVVFKGYENDISNFLGEILSDRYK